MARMKFKALLVTLFLGVTLCTAFAQKPADQKPDVVKATRVIKAKFIGFEVGDYEHAIVKVKGKEESYYIGDYGMDFFLALHPNAMCRLTIQTVDSYIPEANGRMVTERISAVRIGHTSFKSWWKVILRKAHGANLDPKYQPLVDKLTRH